MHLVELPERDGDVTGERKVPDLRVTAEFHGHVHQTPGIGSGLAKPDMEDVAAINNGEEDMLDLHAFCQRDIGARCNVGAVRVVDRQIPALAQMFKSLLRDRP